MKQICLFLGVIHIILSDLFTSAIDSGLFSFPNSPERYLYSIYKTSSDGNLELVATSNNGGDWKAQENYLFMSIECFNGKCDLDLPLLTDSEGYEVFFSESVHLHLAKSTLGSVHSLVKSNTDSESIICFARSYDGKDWEVVSSEIPVYSIQCNTNECDIELPFALSGETYEVNTYEYSLPRIDEIARFLEQATFGTTMEELESFDDSLSTDFAIAKWIQDQMTEKPSLHRAFFRKHVVHQVAQPQFELRAHGPCEVNTKYRKYAISPKDRNKYITIEPIDNMFMLSVNGEVRTLADSVTWVNGAALYTDGTQYRVCREPEEKIGAAVYVVNTDNNRCEEFYVNGGKANVQVYFDENVLVPSKLLMIQDDEASVFNSNFFASNPQEIIITKTLSDTQCNMYSDDLTNVETHALYQNEYYTHKPSPTFIENTIDNPASDGGGMNEELTEGQTLCSNAPRTFLNENSCKMATADASCGKFITGKGVIVCGSPGEVANDPTIEGRLDAGIYDLNYKLGSTSSGTIKQNARKSVWINTILNADDQLRQRVAWILYQILVVAKPSIYALGDTEAWVYYYDILVRNAFGNYGDLLKEISFSPHMAENLSYLDSESTSYWIENYHTFSFPDENFAREIMQLFSIGLCKLNMDGSVVYQSDGTCVPVYTNEDIMEYARVWTGFILNTRRGNIESYKGQNDNDPMDIKKEARDMFPKMGLNGIYVGDFFPLCEDRPKHHFLKKGAKYILLGRSSLPEQHFDPDLWIINDNAKRLSLPLGSELYSLLCNENDGSCDFQSVVELEENLTCLSGTEECDVDTVRVVEVTPNIFYEYIALPCVDQAFQNNLLKVTKFYGGNNACSIPEREIASTACCTTTSDFSEATVTELYWGERVKYETAKSRCESVGAFICKNPQVNCMSGWSPADYCLHDVSYWTNDSCTLKIKIDPIDGRVAMVHSAGSAEMISHVAQDTSQTYFRVHWQIVDTFPNPNNSCGGSNFCEIIENVCVCEVEVEDTAAFSSVVTKEEILEALKVGAYNPSILDYQVKEVFGDVVVHHLSDDERFSENTIFEIVTNAGVTYFLKNVLSSVKVKGTSPQNGFRNTPHFLSFSDNEKRDALHETDAAISHYLYHDNTAPFIATNLIKRFGISNPSPQYIFNTAMAFRSGSYSWESNSGEAMSFGTGKYGDLSATISAILLDDEARSAVLDADPAYGSVREPMLKLLTIMRAFNVTPISSRPLIDLRLNAITELTGQEPYEQQSVFSYFLPEFQPEGPVSNAQLVSPESQLLTSPNIIGLVNGLFSLLKYGLNSAYGGFFLQNCGAHKRDPGDYPGCARGYLDYTPKATTAAGVVDELATLMTSGRLNEESRAIIEDVYSKESDKRMAVIMAQQIIATTAEFHTTGTVKKNGLSRPIPVPGESPTNDYKAVVLVFLTGGADTYNMIVPRCEPLESAYNTMRGILALSKWESNPIQISDSSGQACNDFGIHKKFPMLRDEFDAGNVVFVANTGLLSEEADRSDYREKEKSPLFAHNGMQKWTQRVDPHRKIPSSGILARMAEALANTYNIGSFSLDGVATSLRGASSNSPPQSILNRFGISLFDPFPWSERPNFADVDIRTPINALNQKNTIDSNFFAETWSKDFWNAISENDFLTDILSQGTVTQNFADHENLLMQQLLQVSKLISTKDARNVGRDFFYTTMNGWDSHSSMKEATDSLFSTLNDALDEFWKEMGSQNKKKDVTVVVVSEFGRTLTPNSKSGSDHGWAGNYFILSGAAKQGQLLGTYPESYDNLIDLGRGRLVPTTPIDALWNGVAEWMGVDNEEDLNKVLPNRQNFKDKLFTKNDLFESTTASTSRKLRNLK